MHWCSYIAVQVATPIFPSTAPHAKQKSVLYM